jgi:hypothetical protein
MSGSSINMNNKQATVAGGNYVINNFDLTGNASITFTGPTTLYCYGSVTLRGSVTTSASQPKNLTIVMIANPYNGNPPGSVSVSSSTALYASIYAPQSSVELAGSGDIYGSVLGKSVDMTGTSSIRYDLNFSSNGGVGLVR